MLIEARPRGLRVNYRPGNLLAINFTWPAGELAGRTFASYLGTTALSVVVNGDVMTVEASAAVTAGRSVNDRWRLVDTTGGQAQTLLAGNWRPSTDPAAVAQTTTEIVVVDSITVEVTVNSGQASIVDFDTRLDTAEADIEALDARTALESIGAAVDQSAASAMEQRWIALARECGGTPRKPELKYIGGDVLDVMQLPGGTQKLWVCADIWAGPTVQSDDTYSGPALPTRNACIQEVPAGTFGTMLYDVGSSGLWLDAVVDGGQPADHIWWPTCVLDDGGATLMRVGCVLIGPPDEENPFGVYAGSQIVTLNAFGLFASVTDVTSADLQIDGFLKNSTHTYIFGEEHVGFVDEETLGSKITKVARVVNGSLLTVASWEYWDGDGWSASPAAAVPLQDVDGNDLLGDACVAKIATDHYLMASHSLSTDPWLDTYRSDALTGPWQKIARTPLPGIGQTVAGGTLIAQIPRILNPNTLGNPDERPPAGRSLVMLSRNLLGATAAMADQSILNYLPMFAVVPNQ